MVLDQNNLLDILDKAIDSASTDFFNRSSEKIIVENPTTTTPQGLLNNNLSNTNKSINETFDE